MNTFKRRTLTRPNRYENVPSNTSSPSISFATIPSNTSSPSMNFASLQTKSNNNSPSMNFATINGLSRPCSAPNVDLHDTYMARTHRTEKKLSNFFGDDDVPFDIPINEIETNGLKAMLQSKVPLCYFLYSLLEDYCSENLFFFLEALEFENDRTMNRKEQEESAVYIYNTYLSRKSCLEINIDEKVHNDVSKFVRSINASTKSSNISKCFKTARNSVYQLMEGSFAKFLKSETFYAMKKELGHRIYNDNDKLNAVCKLRDYVIKSEEKYKQILKEDPNNQIAITNSKHNDVIFLLVHEFTKSIVGIDFNEKDIFFKKSHEKNYED